MPSSLPSHASKILTSLHPSASFSLSSSGQITLSPPGPTYLYKTSPSPALQLLGEAASLEHLTTAAPGLAPALLGQGEDDGHGHAWTLSEWHKLSRGLDDARRRQLARRLAGEVHGHTSENGKFGFERPTHCGETEQDNTWEDSWAEFWGKRRIGDFVDRIAGKDGKGDRELWKAGRDIVERVVPALLGKLDIKPALLHGDLWSGNASYSVTSDSPLVFDACSYYGHNEAELGIMRMFGGFGPAFFEEYHKVLPKTEPAEEYEQRVDLYELYHHLNHTLIFGGSYRSGAMRLMNRLLAWADKNGV